MESVYDEIKEGDTIICMIDEFNNGNKSSFDCTVLSKLNNGFDVIYLSGYRSRNDFVSLNDVIAKVDLSQPVVSVKGFSGHFKVFKNNG